MTVGVQLEIYASIGELPHFLPVHQLQNPLCAKLLIINLQVPGQLCRHLILLFAGQILALGPLKQLKCCFAPGFRRYQIQRARHAELRKIYYSPISRLPHHMGANQIEDRTLVVAVIRGEINGRRKFMLP